MVGAAKSSWVKGYFRSSFREGSGHNSPFCYSRSLKGGGSCPLILPHHNRAVVPFGHELLLHLLLHRGVPHHRRVVARRGGVRRHQAWSGKSAAPSTGDKNPTLDFTTPPGRQITRSRTHTLKAKDRSGPILEQHNFEVSAIQS